MWSLIRGVDLPEGKRKRLETMAGRNAVRNTIGASHRENGRAVFRGCFGTRKPERQCRPCAIAGRAVEAQKHPTLAYRPLGLLSSNSDGKLSVPN